MGRLINWCLLGIWVVCGVGCATTRTPDIYVTGINAQDASLLAPAISQYAASVLPPASTTLVLANTTSDMPRDVLTPKLTQSLRDKGFAMAMPTQQIAHGHTLCYWVTPLDNGVLLRMRLDNRLVSRWFAKDAAGVLQIHGAPLVVGEMSHV